MNDHDVAIGTKLRRVLQMLDGDVSKVYAEMNSSFRPRFFPVFQCLSLSERTVGELAMELGISQPGMTQTLAEMENLGLVRLQAGEPDRRSRTVSLTERCLEEAKRLHPVWKRIEGAAKQLDEELPVPLASVLDSVIEALARRSFRERIG